MVCDLARYTIRSIFGRLREVTYLNRLLNDVLYDEHARRAFANNAFDGALTFLGILMGNLVLDEFHPLTIIKIGLSTCLAIGMSGAFGRFLSERAERRRLLKQMEKSMFTDLSDSSLGREAKRKTITISLIDGISPALTAVVPLAPFFLAQASIISIGVSIVSSFVLTFIALFALGMFLGKTSEENILLYGALVVGVGFITSIVIFLGATYFQ